MAPPKGPNQRKKGEGSVFYNAARDRWQGTVSRTENGKRLRRTVTGRTQEEAEQKLEGLQAELTAHTIYLPTELGEQAVEKATKRNETLSDVVLPAVETYVAE